MIDPYNEESAARLMQLGYSNEAIKAITDNVNNEVTELAKQGKSNREIESHLSQFPVIKDQTTIYPWRKEQIDFQVTPEVKQAATKVVAPTVIPIQQVQPPTTMQNIMSGPVGGAIEFVGKGLSRAAPFPGVIKAVTGQDVSQYGTEGQVLNPLPEIITDPFSKLIEGIRNIKKSFVIPGTNIEISGPNTANMIEAGMAMGVPGNPIGRIPRPNEVIPGLKNAGRSLLTIEGGDIGRAIYPKGTPEIPIKTTEQGLGQPQFPITERAGVTGPSISPKGQTSIVGQTSTPSEIVGKIEPAKPVIPTQDVIIEKSSRARQLAKDTGNVEIEKLATDTINQFGDIKPAEVAVGKLGGEPLHTITAADMVAANDEAANLNTILVDKPKADSVLLRDSVVRDETGNLKEMYHGSPLGINKLDVAKARAVAYNPRAENAVFATDNPNIAGGTGEPGVVGYTGARDLDVNFLREELKKDQESLKAELSKEQPNQYAVDLYKRAIQDYKDRISIKNKEAPTVHPVYLNIKNPFDWEAAPDLSFRLSINDRLRWLGQQYTAGTLPDWISVTEFTNALDNYSQARTNGDLFQVLDKILPPKQGIYDQLKQFNYDGIKYQGGMLTGRAPHEVYIAFDNKQIISKFDKRLYKEQLLRLNNGDELTPTGTYKPQKPVTEKQAMSNTDLVESEPSTNAAIGMELVKKAQETGQTGSPTINDLNYGDISQRVFGANHLDPDALVTNQRGVPPSDPLQPSSILDAPPAAEAPILRGLPWYGKGRSPVRAFSAMEVESKIPFLTELHNDAQIADANYTRMMQKHSNELRNTIREVGRYDWKTKKNDAIWDRVSIALEEIDGFNKATGEVSYKDPTTGNVITGTIAQAARALNESNQDVIKLAGRFRNLYDKYWAEGSTAGAATPNSYLQFYNPHKMTEQQRFDFVKGLRRDEHPFFQYPRSNVMHNYETNALKLINRYISEWARVEHLTPWQKDVAEPILTATKAAYMGSPRAAETFEYARNYVLDKLRMPRDTAVKANSAMFDWVDQTLRGIKPFGNRTADMLLRRFGTDDRLAEGLSRGSNNFFINYFQKYRPLPAIRNTMQREFMLPLLPRGNMDLITGQYKMLRNIDGAHEKFLAAGLMPYIEMEHLGTNRLDLFQHAEIGNLSTGFITIHDGIWKDYREGMSHDKIKEKWRVHLYPQPIREAFDDALTNGRIGDIRRLGPNAGNALLGRYATMMTQFPKGPGEVPEYARTGPIAKATWLFSTWTPMSIDYFASLAHNAVTGPKPYIDMYRLGKVFAYLYAADQMWEGFTGKTLASNPITNLPTQPVNAPGPGMVLNAYEAVTGKWNEYLKAIFDEDAKGQKFNKFIADRAIGELMRTKPGITTDIKLFGDEEQKQKKRISR